MPAELENIRDKIREENPGMSEASTWAIATSAFKKKHNIKGKTTEKEMEEKSKKAALATNYCVRTIVSGLTKMAAEEAEAPAVLPFTVRRPGATTLLGNLVPGFGLHPLFGGLQGKGMVLAKGREAYEESPWRVRHPFLFPLLTGLGGVAGGAGLGALIGGAAGGWDEGAGPGALLGAQLGGLAGGVGGTYSGLRATKKRVGELYPEAEEL